MLSHAFELSRGYFRPIALEIEREIVHLHVDRPVVKVRRTSVLQVFHIDKHFNWVIYIFKLFDVGPDFFSSVLYRTRTLHFVLILLFLFKD